MSKTGFDKYLEERLKNPEFAEGYRLAREELEMPQAVKYMIAKTKCHLKLLHTFKVARLGWEMDNEGFVVENERLGMKFIILTNHGTPYFADRNEVMSQIQNYRIWLYGAEEALALFDKKDDDGTQS